MALTKGDVVLVPFPFTDLSTAKLRPAIVLWVETIGVDVTLCFISSQNLNKVEAEEFILDSNDPEFATTGLKTTSKVRVARMVTVSSNLIARKLGRLGTKQIQQLDRCLKIAFQL